MRTDPRRKRKKGLNARAVLGEYKRFATEKIDEAAEKYKEQVKDFVNNTADFNIATSLLQAWYDEEVPKFAPKFREIILSSRNAQQKRRLEKRGGGIAKAVGG